MQGEVHEDPLYYHRVEEEEEDRYRAHHRIYRLSLLRWQGGTMGIIEIGTEIESEIEIERGIEMEEKEEMDGRGMEGGIEMDIRTMVMVVVVES